MFDLASGRVNSSKVNIDKLADELMSIMNVTMARYEAGVEKAVKQTAKETAKAINQNAAGAFKGNVYKKTWASKSKLNRRKHRWESIVYSKEPGYRLAHLLENGHALKRGGRTVGHVGGREHIKGPADEAEKLLEEHIIAYLAGDE